MAKSLRTPSFLKVFVKKRSKTLFYYYSLFFADVGNQNTLFTN